MNRFFLFVVTLLMVGYAGYFLVARPKGPDLLTLVPGDSPVILDWDSPAGACQSFFGTPFAEKLQGIDWPLILGALGYGHDEITGAGKTVHCWTSFVKSHVVQKLLSEKTVIALLPENDKKQEAAATIKKSLLLLSKAGRQFNNIQTMKADDLFAGRSVVQNYQGYVIYRYLVKKRYPLYVVIHKDLLIAAFDPSPVRKCLDLMLAGLVGKGYSIIDNSAYTPLKQRAGDRNDFFLYCNIDEMTPLLRQVGEQQGLALAFKSQVADIPGHGLRQVALYHQYRDRVHQVTSIVHFDREKLSSFQQHLADRVPIKDKTLLSTPTDMQAYLWSNWLELPHWWKATRENSSGPDFERADRLDAAVTNYTGLDLEHFFDLFGNQISLIVKEVATSGFFPIPRISMRISLSDQMTMQSLLDKFIAGLPHHRSMVAAVPVVSVLAAGGLMQPSYALLDKDLLLADGRDLIDDMVKPGKKILILDPDFRKLDMGMREPANLLVFARTKQLIYGLKELASWVGTNIAIRDGRAGARSKILVDQAVIPLLNGLTMFKACALRAYLKNDEFVVQSGFLMIEE